MGVLRFSYGTMSSGKSTLALQIHHNLAKQSRQTDFRGLLFDGTRRMFEIADERVELHVEARCWCGARATNNARLVNGALVRQGETIVVGDTVAAEDTPLFGDVVTDELLCRRHSRAGLVAPDDV